MVDRLPVVGWFGAPVSQADAAHARVGVLPPQVCGTGWNAVTGEARRVSANNPWEVPMLGRLAVFATIATLITSVGFPAFDDDPHGAFDNGMGRANSSVVMADGGTNGDIHIGS